MLAAVLSFKSAALCLIRWFDIVVDEFAVDVALLPYPILACTSLIVGCVCSPLAFSVLGVLSCQEDFPRNFDASICAGNMAETKQKTKDTF